MAQVEPCVHNQDPDHIDNAPPDHGRIEIRKVRTETELNDHLNFPHLGQAFGIEPHCIGCFSFEMIPERGWGALLSRDFSQENF
jgi:hypothetical protein